MDKQPISKKWQEMFEKGGLIDATKSGKLLELLKNFPENMEIPKEGLECRDAVGRTFLHYAAETGHLDQVTHIAQQYKLDLMPVIYQKDYDGFSKDFRGQTFLHLAAYQGHFLQVIDMVRELKLDLTIILNDQNKYGETIFDIAKKQGTTEQAEELRETVKQIAVEKSLFKKRDEFKKQVEGRKKTKTLVVKPMKNGR